MAASELTEARARAVAGPRGQLILTFVNRVRLDFAATWVSHVTLLGLTNWMVGATDEGAFSGLLAQKVPCFSMRTNLPQGEWDWGSPSFKALGTHKVNLVHTILSWRLQLVITDVDALVLREPFAYMSRWPDAGFLTTSDHLGNSSGSDDGGLEDHSAVGSAFNIGYMYFNHSAMPLVQAWKDRMTEGGVRVWDQGEFNSLAKLGLRAGDATGLSDRRLFWSFEHRVVGGVLPLASFAGGHAHFVSQMAARRGEQPYSVHTTFQYGGAPGKRHRLREAMLWLDPPSHYTPAAGVLTYTPDVPDALVAPLGGMSAAGHVELMRHQLYQLRAALLLAFALGRVLVLPPLVCGFDKYWAPITAEGVIPGAWHWALPIRRCPLDHLLNPAELREPTRYVREYSFLEHPKTPSHFKRDEVRATLELSADGTYAQSVAARRKLIEHSKGHSVLHVTNLPEVATALWESARRAQQSQRRERRQAYGRAAGSASVEQKGMDAGEPLISADVWKAFRAEFSRLQGGWCCAPYGQKPHAVGFRIME